LMRRRSLAQGLWGKKRNNIMPVFLFYVFRLRLYIVYHGDVEVYGAPT
jgi:hypothetical protein